MNANLRFCDLNLTVFSKMILVISRWWWLAYGMAMQIDEWRSCALIV